MTTIDYVAGNERIIVLVKRTGDDWVVEVCDARTGMTEQEFVTPAPRYLAKQLLEQTHA